VKRKTDPMSESNRELTGYTMRLPSGLVPAGHTVTEGGWVIPMPATLETVREASRDEIAPLRRQLDLLLSEVRSARATQTAREHKVIDQGDPLPSMLDVRGCAAALGISVRSWQRLVEQGDAPRPVKIGRSSRWPRSDVEAFIASRAGA
jgi:predicted DNA-binding transcriptional regulator AlpA